MEQLLIVEDDIGLNQGLAKLSDWKERVAECRSSGMSVREWCEAQGLCLQTYYRWEKVVLAAASGQLQAQQSGVACTPTSSAPMFAELAPLKPTVSARKPEGAVATIRCGEVAIDLYAGVDPAFIVSLCKELQYAQ